MPTKFKFCGLKTSSDVATAAAVGASYVGFVFFAKSPRNLDLPTARALALDTPVGVAKVGLMVDPSDGDLDQILGQVPLDMVQLHGKESLTRVAEVKARTGLPVMKAIGISGAADVAHALSYGGVADQLLVDAKVKGSALPGGNGQAFDWSLIRDVDWPCPWMLAGGLDPETVAEAIRQTGANQVDVSSGIEAAPGIKDPLRMEKFAQAVMG